MTASEREVVAALGRAIARRIGEPRYKLWFDRHTKFAWEAGLLTVNLPSAGVEYQLPFGGTKDSSFGPKEQGPAAMEFYSDYKTVYLKY